MGEPKLIADVTALHTVQCGSCGVWHAIPRTRYEAAEKEGGFWFCPNGHERGFREGTQKRDADKKRMEWAEQEIKLLNEQIKAHKQDVTTLKGKLTKERKRIKGGVCPCCNRHFTELEMHMANKHPDFKPTED